MNKICFNVIRSREQSSGQSVSRRVNGRMKRSDGGEG